MLKQKTLKDSFSLSGKGLHTGLDLTVTFNPAPDNHGYKIQRIDLEGQPTWAAILRCRCRQRIRNYPWNCNLQKRSKGEHSGAWYGSPLCIGYR